MILSDGTLHKRLHEIIVTHADDDLINPASIDIRIGATLILEEPQYTDPVTGEMYLIPRHVPVGGPIRLDGPVDKYFLAPGEFVLVAVYEQIHIPDDMAGYLYLKSSIARAGYDHSLAFWVDPGWSGILTYEIRNATRYTTLPLTYKMPFAQLVVQQLDAPALKPYRGRYQGAQEVEASKP